MRAALIRRLAEAQARAMAETAPQRLGQRWFSRSRRAKQLRSSEDLEVENRWFDYRLKRRVARFALFAVGAQLVVANAVFVIYAWRGRHWNVPSDAIQAWLAATAVQMIGVLYIIAVYLFPKSGTPLGRDVGHSPDGD